MKKLLFAMGIGAGLAWMFDPEAGARRREMLRRKLDERGLGEAVGMSSANGSAPSPVADYPAPLTATGH